MHSFPAPPLDKDTDVGPKTPETRLRELIEYLETLRRSLGRTVPHFKAGSAVYNPPNILAAGTTTTTVTVTGAALGDLAFASFSLDITGLQITAYVDSANSVTVVLTNPTALAINLASGTLRAWTVRPVTT